MCNYTFSDFISSPAGQILIILLSVFLMYLSLRLADIRIKKIEISASKRQRRYVCYNDFLDAMLNRQMDLTNSNYHKEFCKMYNRLSIVASPEMSRLLDAAQAGNANIPDLIKAMRNDLYEGDKNINENIGQNLFLIPNSKK